MDNLDRKSNGFINHVLSMNQDQKIDLFNLIQYGMLSIIPVLLLNKSIQAFVPEADEEKGSLEIMIEIILQLAVLLIGIYYIHRIITYVPTYSGEDYGQVNLVNMVLAFLVIVMSLQTKLGEKAEILYTRVLNLWYGEDGKNSNKHSKASGSAASASASSPSSKHNSNGNIIRVSQPGLGLGGSSVPSSQMQIPQPPPSSMQQPIVYDPLNRTMVQPQQASMGMDTGMPPSYDAPQYGGGVMEPNFDQMYQEPMAANGVLGFGGSAF